MVLISVWVISILVPVFGINSEKTKVQHSQGRCIYHVNGIQMTPDTKLVTIKFTDGSLVFIRDNVDLTFSTKASRGRPRVLDLVITATSMDPDMMSYRTTIGQNTYTDAVKTESLKAYFRFDLQVEPKFDPITISMQLDNKKNRYTSFEVSYNCAGKNNGGDPVEGVTGEGDNEGGQDEVTTPGGSGLTQGGEGGQSEVTTPRGSGVTQGGEGGQEGVTTGGNEQQEGTTEGGGDEGNQSGVTPTEEPGEGGHGNKPGEGGHGNKPGEGGHGNKPGNKDNKKVHPPKVIEGGAVTGLDVVIRSPGRCSYDLTALSVGGLLPARSYTFDDGATFTSDQPYKLRFAFKPRHVTEVGILGTCTGPTDLQVVAPKGWGTRNKELVRFPLGSKSVKQILVTKGLIKPIYKELIFTWSSAEIEELLITLPCKK